MKHFLFSLLCCFSLPALAQVTGGQQQMVFLKLPNSPHISALGGIHVASPDADLSFGFQNPALLQPELHRQIGLAYNIFYAGSSVANAAYVHDAPKQATTFGAAIQYLNYGSFQQTDASGNILGDVHASEFAVTLAAGRSYKERWRYGAALKVAHSSLADRSSTALLADVGISYEDTARGLMLGAVAKNMGLVLSKYNPSNSAEPLPFDLQLGISKTFRHVPLRLFTTLHHLYQWDIRYDNPADAVNTGFGPTQPAPAGKSYFADKLFRHFIFGAELTLGKRLQVGVSYNHLRRGDLGLEDKKGLTGMSLGLGLLLNKLRVQYARNYYHVSGATNELGLVVLLDNFAPKKRGGD